MSAAKERRVGILNISCISLYCQWVSTPTVSLAQVRIPSQSFASIDLIGQNNRPLHMIYVTWLKIFPTPAHFFFNLRTLSCTKLFTLTHIMKSNKKLHLKYVIMFFLFRAALMSQQNNLSRTTTPAATSHLSSRHKKFTFSNQSTNRF